MNLVIDPRNGVPMTDQLVTGISGLIRSRQLLAGVKLPSIRALAASQQISRFPVIEAYDRLSSLGFIVPKHGSGFYVANHMGGESGASGGSDPRLAEEESHQILQQFNYPGESLKLSSGFVPEAWRDIEGIAQTVRQVMRMDPSCVIDYAMPHGDANLRHQIQMRLAIVGIEADISNVIVTSGASQALDLVVRFMLKPGDTVFVEDPGYYNLFGLLKLQGVRIVGVPRLANGPDVEVAEHLLKTIKPKLFFINTVFHNPTATNVAPQVAFKLLQLAQQHDFMIVEDDIYADFQTTPTQRLASLDQLDHVIYVGGLSKTLSSSLRIGYLAAKRDLIKDLVDVKVLTSLGGSRFSECVVAALLERGTYRKYLERLRRRIHDTLSTAVQRLEENGWEVFDEPSGGNFIWTRVPGIDDSMLLVEHALKFGITLAPGSYYRPNGEASPWVRINTAHTDDPRAIRFLEHMGKGAGKP
ncbi:aminotransferase-like domain-containing protein [Caballeronia sordidicola]|jgi:DNA-binding transcriptional MocR family regulator|uniref:Transcriptional regulator, GntR family domain / Aspartate aminotransferase n=1 Tax=Caballeronia sordidicola TaxID=196367 RepID=A0A226X8A6_CABSO|nr:Transcriptional regulator, GntR family domain / Aspartate aminotransferase [Caballeronia sordidicola]